MNYLIINFEDIPKGSQFIYQREDLEETIKCKKTGKYSFSYKQGGTTWKRYCPLPKDEWYCCVSTRTYNNIMK